MQYLNQFDIQQALSIPYEGKEIMVYENSEGHLVIGELESLQQIQMNQMNFTKEVSKAVILPNDDAVVVLMEEPDFGYLDPKSGATNSIALLSKSNFKTLASYSLKPAEVANCILYIERKGAGLLSI